MFEDDDDDEEKMKVYNAEQKWSAAWRNCTVTQV